jgi:hypothetical protein
MHRRPGLQPVIWAVLRSAAGTRRIRPMATGMVARVMPTGGTDLTIGVTTIITGTDNRTGTRPLELPVVLSADEVCAFWSCVRSIPPPALRAWPDATQGRAIVTRSRPFLVPRAWMPVHHRWILSDRNRRGHCALSRAC